MPAPVNTRLHSLPWWNQFRSVMSRAGEGRLCLRYFIVVIEAVSTLNGESSHHEHSLQSAYISLDLLSHLSDFPS